MRCRHILLAYLESIAGCSLVSENEDAGTVREVWCCVLRSLKVRNMVLSGSLACDQRWHRFCRDLRDHQAGYGCYGLLWGTVNHRRTQICKTTYVALHGTALKS